MLCNAHRYLLRLLCVIAVTIVYGSVINAQSSGTLIREGDRFFVHGKYRNALQYYRQGGNAQTWDKRVKLRAAICQYEINEIDGAMVLLTNLVRQGKTQPDVFYYLARCHHEKNQFTQAVSNYKQFLRRTRKETTLRQWVKDEIVRCTNGIGLRHGVERAYVENIGPAINTAEDEYAPVPSPNYQERLYFSSSRDGSLGGPVTDDGSINAKYGKHRADIYLAEHQNGIWQPAAALGRNINSTLHDVIQGFSVDGQQIYFLRSAAVSGGTLMVDTFSAENNAQAQSITLGPFRPQHGDRDLFLYNDTIMLFASDRPGGLGGYDIYYAIKRRDRWREPVNIGAPVNSPYDDVSPFLARNGRLLFFSSNRLESIGGLDVFSALFDDATAQWSIPENMGLPINSAGDDHDFVLVGDGMKAYLSSRRKSGFGGTDLYTAYFKEQVKGHLTLSLPLTFAHFETGDREIADTGPATPVIAREYVISDLWFDTNDRVITPQNIRKLEVLTNLMLIYPEVKCELVCHDVSTGKRSYDLFFSVKKAEQAAQHLVRKGVAANRISIKGCGAYYPVARSDAAIPNPAADRLNRRIGVYVYHTEGHSVTLIRDQPRISDNLADPRGAAFHAAQSTLVYRVQIGNTQQLLEHDIFDNVTDAMVHYDNDTHTYRYLIGMLPLFHDALMLQDELREMGFADAFVVPYVEGRSLDRRAAADLISVYPDLVNFLE